MSIIKPLVFDELVAAVNTFNPIYALAYNNRGYVYEAQGRNDEAIIDFNSALLLDPSLIGARDGLRRLGAPETLLAQAEARVQQGKSLVEKNCSPCHAVGLSGESPNKKAPPFLSAALVGRIEVPRLDRRLERPLDHPCGIRTQIHWLRDCIVQALRASLCASSAGDVAMPARANRRISARPRR
jgi:tetratricopeptide (TPR) repeat protein